ncbi:uncharacterized protein GIQ15_02002 [Arthroderma uncinatum]|uniref:uncharacterized protein n=1 Tax=Arthroderma uncinatum TaxID=74035 RepID=UPI00144AE5E9|nr:uncharacterized protein GIQ15_02002 [Arthroderma uncinatum]KAF3482678.1 hypothetical protein GIQ15_02002 [Arthroderma uncinatum]
MILNVQPLEDSRGAYDTTGVPKPQPPQSDEVATKAPYSATNAPCPAKDAQLYACKNEIEHPPDSSVFLAPDNAENTRVELSQRFNGVAAKKPLAPEDVRKAFLENETDSGMPQAMYDERWGNNACICRTRKCTERKKLYPKCRGSSSDWAKGDIWIDSEFSAW